MNASVSYSLTAGAEVENLILLAGVISGAGNGAANRIVGNASGNGLGGGAGNDWIDGDAGGDWIDGGAGADTLIGGPGDDSFAVDDAGDAVFDYGGLGHDTVNAWVNYTLATEVEDLILAAGAGALYGTGNDLANRIVGNASVNGLNGGAGNDWLDGGAGADTMTGWTGDERPWSTMPAMRCSIIRAWVSTRWLRRSLSSSAPGSRT